MCRAARRIRHTDAWTLNVPSPPPCRLNPPAAVPSRWCTSQLPACTLYLHTHLRRWRQLYVPVVPQLAPRRNCARPRVVHPRRQQRERLGPPAARASARAAATNTAVAMDVTAGAVACFGRVRPRELRLRVALGCVWVGPHGRAGFARQHGLPRTRRGATGLWDAAAAVLVRPRAARERPEEPHKLNGNVG
eukprot:366391-Chlamydomonas_euryale.AAC.30